MKSKYKEYLQDRNRLHTNADKPWTIEKAWLDVGDEAVYVQMFGERVRLSGTPNSIEYFGVVGFDCDNSRSFPEFDDDPRLLMLAHQGKIDIYRFQNEETDKDPSGPVEVPTRELALGYMDAEGIPKD